MNFTKKFQIFYNFTLTISTPVRHLPRMIACVLSYCNSRYFTNLKSTLYLVVVGDLVVVIVVLVVFVVELAVVIVVVIVVVFVLAVVVVVFVVDVEVVLVVFVVVAVVVGKGG
jgi:hypothetical protein